MTPRHAAALALVGWYVMLPPREWDHFYTEAPLSEWHRAGGSQFAKEYATEKECKARIEDDKAFVKDWRDIPKERVTARIMAMAAKVERCIASDDPRLKEK